MIVSLTTADFVDRAATVHRHRLGIVDEPGIPGALGRLTYGEVAQRCAGMAVALEAMGIGKGERVAIISPNAAKMLIALYAVTGTGRILVPMNFRLTADEARFIVKDAGAAALLVDPLLEERFANVKGPNRIVLDGVSDAELFAPAGKEMEWANLDERMPATLNYTSGTTASPKGVILSHRSAWLNAVSVGMAFGLVEGDRYLHSLPIFHVNGWGLPLACASLGVPQVIQRDVRGAEILERVKREAITLLCGAAPVAAAIEQSARDLVSAGGSVPGSGTTRMVSGGAPTPPAVIEKFERTTGWEMIHAYGLTETGPVLTVNRVPRDEVDEPGERGKLLASAGAPILGVRLAVASDGEVLARTAKAMSGYWNQPELSEHAFDGEWILTGDGGELAEDGRLRLTDRKKDVIVSGGENVSSLEVEACLHDHPDVQDVAVIGIPHPRWGETPKAIVVLRDGARFDADDLIAFCRARLAHFKCPSAVELRDSLPRTATGKVQKYQLRRLYSGGQESPGESDD